MTRPPIPERVAIAGPVGAIEAVVEEPAGAGAFAVVCHPHPLFGGTLDNKVVHTLARTFQEHGAATIRFNFRGVGASEGTHADGVGESDDTRTVIVWGGSRWPRANLWLAGFSFGGAVAIRVAGESQAALLVTVAPAVKRVPVETGALPASSWLIVQGDADDVVPAAETQGWAARFAPQARIVLVPGAGHFFHGRLHDLKDVVAAFVEERRKEKPGRT
jgi:alpha/beta superfamily hydrolase